MLMASKGEPNNEYGKDSPTSVVDDLQKREVYFLMFGCSDNFMIDFDGTGIIS